MRILQNNEKKFLISKRKLRRSENKIDNYIKEHHDESLQKYSDVLKTLQLLRQNCQFLHIKQRIETYVKKCNNYQKNKHATHTKYEKIQYQESLIVS